ncbi:sulfotransferase family 2 domain-containing protein [Roseibium aggregatum]|uniref:Sulfotransferase family protein n=1 Tax=Roseibium aggregatum TaxID=187304 RepID=A0A939EJ95_9HYPH|nr:sulfotransferase family 2 domain-containing protein [Roseibium aggregatum]MBN9672669.1 hypothetical protein [Roseibium aggregatum]
MAIRSIEELQPRMIIVSRRRLVSSDYAENLKASMERLGHKPAYAHARLIDVDKSARKGTIPFAVVRNPWARVVSRFKFAVQTRSAVHGEQLSGKAGFEAFLDERHKWGHQDYLWHRPIMGWYPQAEYVTDETGKVACTILRQEYLAEEARTYFDIRTEVPRKNVSAKIGSGYQDLYDAKSIQIVGDWYKKDIETFGFDFDKPAQKNTLYSER